jgi:hypothetical protein
VNIDLEQMWPPRKNDILYQDMGNLGGTVLKVISVIVPLWNPPDDCIMRCIILHDMFTDLYEFSASTTTCTGITMHITRTDLKQLNAKLYLIMRSYR